MSVDLGRIVAHASCAVVIGPGSASVYIQMAKWATRKLLIKENIMDLFNLPLSQVAFDQVLSIQQVMENSTREEQNNDASTYSRGSAKFRPAAA